MRASGERHDTDVGSTTIYAGMAPQPDPDAIAASRGLRSSMVRILLDCAAIDRYKDEE